MSRRSSKASCSSSSSNSSVKEPSPQSVREAFDIWGQSCNLNMNKSGKESVDVIDDDNDNYDNNNNNNNNNDDSFAKVNEDDSIFNKESEDDDDDDEDTYSKDKNMTKDYSSDDDRYSCNSDDDEIFDDDDDDGIFVDDDENDYSPNEEGPNREDYGRNLITPVPAVSSRRRKRRVRFAPHVKVIEIAHVHDIPKSIHATMWWTKDEFRLLKKEQEVLIEKYKQQQQKGTTFNNESLRGLESKLVRTKRNGRNQMYEIITAARSAVLNEQDLQIMSQTNGNDDIQIRPFYDFAEIRAAYIRETRLSKQIAINYAKQDEYEVQEYISDTRSQFGFDETIAIDPYYSPFDSKTHPSIDVENDDDDDDDDDEWKVHRNISNDPAQQLSSQNISLLQERLVSSTSCYMQEQCVAPTQQRNAKQPRRRHSWNSSVDENLHNDISSQELYNEHGNKENENEECNRKNNSHESHNKSTNINDSDINSTPRRQVKHLPFDRPSRSISASGNSHNRSNTSLRGASAKQSFAMIQKIPQRALNLSTKTISHASRRLLSTLTYNHQSSPTARDIRYPDQHPTTSLSGRNKIIRRSSCGTLDCRSIDTIPGDDQPHRHFCLSEYNADHTIISSTSLRRSSSIGSDTKDFGQEDEPDYDPQYESPCHSTSKRGFISERVGYTRRSSIDHYHDSFSVNKHCKSSRDDDMIAAPSSTDTANLSSTDDGFGESQDWSMNFGSVDGDDDNSIVYSKPLKSPPSTRFHSNSKTNLIMNLLSPNPPRKSSTNVCLDTTKAASNTGSSSTKSCNTSSRTSSKKPIYQHDTEPRPTRTKQKPQTFVKGVKGLMQRLGGKES